MKRSRNLGFSLLEIMIVVSIIGLIAAIAIPNFVRANTASKKSTCINNLVQIHNATAEWALENKKAAGYPVEFTDISSYLRGSTICPAGGTTFNNSYSITDTTNLPTCLKVPAGPDAHILPLDTTE